MSFILFKQKCDDCGKSWTAAIGVCVFGPVAEPPKQCPHCRSSKLSGKMFPDVHADIQQS